ncbi:MAG: NADH-quinone oxidoreductase subunit C [Lachnospiraceae bacterium]|nr:NADH-quinone oxidoreductase subunit C [Lachnospiraceae bacterium]
MNEIFNPENKLEEINHEKLLRKVLVMKNKNMRLAQMCAAFVEGKYELSYSFADDETYEMSTLRLIIEPDTAIPSITEIYPYAFFYENEINELFGVNVKFINHDYNKKLYRIDAESPFVKKEDK